MFKKLLVLLMAFTISLSAKALTPNEAFDVELKNSKDAVIVDFKLGEEIYIYKDRLKFQITKPKNILLNDLLNMPQYETYKNYNVYNKNVEFYIPNKLIKDYVADKSFTLKVSWQGCSESGICYQPLNKEFNLYESNDGTYTTNVQSADSEQNNIAKMIEQSNIFLTFLSFFGFGLLLSLTPCLFPMIPILSSIIVSKSGTDNKNGFLISLVYVVFMALAYALAGVLAGSFGENMQATLQAPLVIWSFSAVFVLLSLSMFGFYEISLPSSITNVINKKTDSSSSKGLVGVAVMGFLSALIVSPCVAPPLAGALIYISQSGNAVVGGLALFVMGIGMGVPLLVIGAFGSKVLPKPGMWMDAIKAIFGIMLLGMALWLLSRVLSAKITMILWAILLIGSAIYFARLKLFENKIGKSILKISALLFGIYGIVLFTASFLGGVDPLSPFGGINQEHKNTNVTTIKTLKEIEEIIQTSQKPVLVEFNAAWCVNCKELEEKTFSDPRVAKALEDFNFVQVDVTDNTEEDKKIMDKLGVFGPPSMIFFKDKKELKEYNIVGFINADDFLKHLEKINKL